MQFGFLGMLNFSLFALRSKVPRKRYCAERRKERFTTNRQKADILCNGQTNQQTFGHILKGELIYQMILEGLTMYTSMVLSALCNILHCM